MRVELTRTATFEAAHFLPNHGGVCRQVHGHSYRLEVVIHGTVKNDGMVMDFADLAEVVRRAVLDDYDHRLLNDVVANPTAENVAIDAYERLEHAGLDLVRVRLWETERSHVTVSAE